MDKATVVDKEFDEALDSVASARGRLRRKLVEEGKDAAALFEEQSPLQKAWGKCVGKLILAKSNDAVEDAFSWLEAQDCMEGKKLPVADRVTGFFHALASLGLDESHYRILRRMYIKANTND